MKILIKLNNHISKRKNLYCFNIYLKIFEYERNTKLNLKSLFYYEEIFLVYYIKQKYHKITSPVNEKK